VFGLSSGAVIALEAARTLDRVTRAAVYEPPFYAEGISHDGIRQLNTDIEQGDLGTALIGALVTAGTAPAPIRALPRPVARLLGRIVLSVDARGRGPESRLRDLLPGVRYDFNAVAGMDGRMRILEALDKPVLLLNGTASPAFLQQATDALQTILPDARRIVLDGLGHDGPWNRSRGGSPEVVAAALREFFTH